MAPPRSRQSRRLTNTQRQDKGITKTASPSASKAGASTTNEDPFNLSKLNAALPTDSLPSRLIRCQFCDMVFAKSYYTAKHQFTHAPQISDNLKAAITGKLAAEKPDTQCVVCHRAFDNISDLRHHRFQTEH